VSIDKEYRMIYRDQKLTCERCGRTFFFTVTEQRRIAEELGEDYVVPPKLCEECRRGAQRSDQLAETQRVERAELAARAPVAERTPAAERTPVAERTPAVEHAPTRERAPERRPSPERAPAEERAPHGKAHPSIAEVFPHEEGGVEVKLIGTVKWFSRRRGYGFITKADGEDLFFHRSEVHQGEGELLEEGQKVEFQIRETNKGPEAFNVSVLPEE
jgi:CspA family cold shock protein